MKYKVDKYIIDANSPVEALKAVQAIKDIIIKDADEYYFTHKQKDKAQTFASKYDGDLFWNGKYWTVKIASNLHGASEEFLKLTRDSVKDYQPPFAIWVKDKGQWKMWGGTHSQHVDRDAYLAEGYEDVKVVKNGESPKDSIKDSLTKEEKELVDYAIDNLDHDNSADKLVRVMSIYYSEYAKLARKKPNEIKEYFKQVIDDSVKDAFAIYNTDKNKYLTYNGWGNKTDSNIQLFENEAYAENIKNAYYNQAHIKVVRLHDDDLDYLTEEEEKAVDDYRQAINSTNNPKLLKLYQHILEEELEHIEELTSAEVVEDSSAVKDYDNFGIIALLDKAKQYARSDDWKAVKTVCLGIIDIIKTNYLKDACKAKDDNSDVKQKALRFLDLLKQSINSEMWQIVANDAYSLIDMLKRNKLAK